jgi:hypothetical protein
VSDLIYEVINKPKNLPFKLLDHALCFASDQLKLDVDFVLEFTKMEPYHFGLCDYDEEEITITIAKGLSTQDAIRTLFHELVHVKQYVDGRLEAGSPQRWLGNIIEDAYHNLPWEVEAFELEQKLFVDFWTESV